ncbi:MAG: hypothetical protein EOP53_05890 [Sphingobacteriales bacterium]|nr:MAG: hypothetical protein EOP53_05890 [Sphingobacteriales bacterium]
MRGLIITVFLMIFGLQVNAQRLPEKPIQKKENMPKQQLPPRIISTEAGSDTIPLRQVDGTVLHILGSGSLFESYTETIDGYTIVIAKDGFYYYAVQTKDGNLLPSDVRAKDPADRTKKEQKKLASLQKHLRYTGETLEDISKKKKDFYHDYNLQIERSNEK